MAQEQQRHEPKVRAQPSGWEKRLFEGYERAESIILSLVALAFIVLAGLALVATAIAIATPLLKPERDYSKAVTGGIDAAFLVIILSELLHTTLSWGPISEQLQEFLVIGVTAAVRHSLELAAGKGNSRELVLDLTINAVGAVVLVGGLWLVRQQLRADKRAAEGRDTAPPVDAPHGARGQGQDGATPSAVAGRDR